jgi:hypothetical protein
VLIQPWRFDRRNGKRVVRVNNPVARVCVLLGQPRNLAPREAHTSEHGFEEFGRSHSLRRVNRRANSKEAGSGDLSAGQCTNDPAVRNTFLFEPHSLQYVKRCALAVCQPGQWSFVRIPLRYMKCLIFNERLTIH